jgi:hypothetical protein
VSNKIVGYLADELRIRGIDIPEVVLEEAFEEAEADMKDDSPEEEEDYWDDRWEDGDGIDSPMADGTYFAFPGSNSALRAATPKNPRNLPCPSCNEPNRLTPADKARGYQCDMCADRAERGGDY